MQGQPKPGFYIAVLLVILGLLGYGLSKYMGGGNKTPTAVSAPASSPGDSNATTTPSADGGVEAPDSNTATTVKEYSYVPAAKMPAISGASDYSSIGNERVVRFALNVWAGWAPIIYANGGMKPGKVWKAPGGKDFKVELVLLDDPVQMASAYASGKVQIGWATVDMLPLFMENFRKDPRTFPRVFQQVDWSNGGDGIVVRANIKTASDLRGKQVVLAQNSPSHFFLLNTLINAGVSPADVDMRFTDTAFSAAAAYNSDKKISGVVSWAPDIYNLSEAKGNRMLVSSQTANKLIADVWYARADFAKDNPALWKVWCVAFLTA
jgi:NitT/TauT family transport system substrate-binding protein